MTPMRPPRPCTHHGCPALVHPPASRCPEHVNAQGSPAWAKREYDRKRNAEQPRERGGWRTPEWRALRELVLKRDPICKICGQAPSTVADHIVAVRFGGAPLDLANVQGACRPCNSRKCASSEGGYGNRPKGKPSRPGQE